MKNMVSISGIILLCLFAFQKASASESTGMQFLLTGPSAYNMGISEAHTASLSGSSAIYINPAMLAREETNSATLSYMLWPVTDTQNSFAGVTFVRDRDAFGLAFLSSLIDDINHYGNQPSSEPVGSFAIRYFSIATSYARSFGPLSFGLTGMYLYEQYLVDDASGVGLNAGINLSIMDDRISLASSLRNLGSMNELRDTSTNLPTLVSFGADIKLLQFSTTALEDEIPFMISLLGDYNLPINEIEKVDGSINAQDEGYVNLGLELNISEIIDLRTGYRSGDTQRRFSYGAGVLINEFYINYAFLPYETGFGTAHAISLQYSF